MELQNILEIQKDLKQGLILKKNLEKFLNVKNSDNNNEEKRMRLKKKKEI